MITGYAYVVADLLHIGHLRFLERCKGYCDKLIVGVLTDDATMEKKDRPIIPFDERLAMVQALKCVDKAVPQLTYSPLPFVKQLKPDTLFESISHEPGAIRDAKRVARMVIVLPYYEAQSSTKIKEKICKAAKPQPSKA